MDYLMLVYIEIHISPYQSKRLYIFSFKKKVNISTTVMSVRLCHYKSNACRTLDLLYTALDLQLLSQPQQGN